MRPSRAARHALPFVAWLFAVALLVQVLTAGLALFVGPGWWIRHREWVHAFEWLSVVAVVLAHAGRSSKGVVPLAWATVVLLFVQYATIGFRERGGPLALAAVHPVSAMLLFWTAVELARRSWTEVP
jgi:hypothetical protein